MLFMCASRSPWTDSYIFHTPQPVDGQGLGEKSRSWLTVPRWEYPPWTLLGVAKPPSPKVIKFCRTQSSLVKQFEGGQWTQQADWGPVSGTRQPSAASVLLIHAIRRSPWSGSSHPTNEDGMVRAGHLSGITQPYMKRLASENSADWALNLCALTLVHSLENAATVEKPKTKVGTLFVWTSKSVLSKAVCHSARLWVRRICGPPLPNEWQNLWPHLLRTQH